MRGWKFSTVDDNCLRPSPSPRSNITDLCRIEFQYSLFYFHRPVFLYQSADCFKVSNKFKAGGCFYIIDISCNQYRSSVYIYATFSILNVGIATHFILSHMTVINPAKLARLIFIWKQRFQNFFEHLKWREQNWNKNQ